MDLWYDVFAPWLKKVFGYDSPSRTNAAPAGPPPAPGAPSPAQLEQQVTQAVQAAVPAGGVRTEGELLQYWGRVY